MLLETVRQRGVLRLFAGMETEIICATLKGGIRWMYKDMLDAIVLRLVLRSFGLVASS